MIIYKQIEATRKIGLKNVEKNQKNQKRQRYHIFTVPKYLIMYTILRKSPYLRLVFSMKFCLLIPVFFHLPVQHISE